jgi:hypothetical protein
MISIINQYHSSLKYEVFILFNNKIFYIRNNKIKISATYHFCHCVSFHLEMSDLKRECPHRFLKIK